MPLRTNVDSGFQADTPRVSARRSLYEGIKDTALGIAKSLGKLGIFSAIVGGAYVASTANNESTSDTTDPQKIERSDDQKAVEALTTDVEFIEFLRGKIQKYLDDHYDDYANVDYVMQRMSYDKELTRQWAEEFIAEAKELNDPSIPESTKEVLLPGEGDLSRAKVEADMLRTATEDVLKIMVMPIDGKEVKRERSLEDKQSDAHHITTENRLKMLGGDIAWRNMALRREKK